jgi:Ca-activated chloride channel family protein
MMPMTPIAALMTEEEVAAFGRRVDASENGFGALECARGLLPLTAMHIEARVRGVMAAIDLAQTFVNTTGEPIEATYIFPLPDRLAVHRFRMEVAGRTIDGVIDERGAARQHYDDAIAAGQRAAITEEERPGVFTLRVGNLMPGETATVRLSLVGPLPVDDGEVTFRFPLVVAPRYMPGATLAGEQAGLGRELDTDAVPDASRISPPVMLPGMPNPVRLAIRIAIHDPALRELASSLPTAVVARDGAHLIELEPGARLDRDFILRWRNDAAMLGSSLVCSDDADGRAGTFMLTLVPPSTRTVAAKPRDVVFVIDRSGSMEGWKIVAARRAVGRMIDSLTSRDQFCVLAFDTDVEAIPATGLTHATDRERFRAVEALAKIEARGGTEMTEPLVRALDLLGGGYHDRERIVMFVTDGQVGNEDGLLHELASRMRNARMFTLGVDQAVNAGFLRRLAAAGGGLCELVESEDRLDAVMAKIHRRIGTPIATELELRATELEIDVSSVSPMTARGQLPDVHAGAPVVVLGRYRGRARAESKLEFTGSSFGEPYHAAVVRDADREATTDLAASWARARIRDLEDRYAAGAKELEVQIVETSKSFSVLSRFTAFLAIDRAQVVKPGTKPRQIVQPVESVDATRSGHRRGGAPQLLRARMASMAPMAPMPLGRPMAPPPAPAGAPPPITMTRPASLAAIAAGGADRGLGTVGLGDLEDDGDDGLTFDGHGDLAVDRIDASVYLAALAELARELATLGAAAPSGAGMALKLLRQRLHQWIEDLRSVGGHDALTAAVATHLERLTLESSAEIASALAKLAAGAAPPTPPKPPKTARAAFWK